MNPARPPKHTVTQSTAPWLVPPRKAKTILPNRKIKRAVRPTPPTDDDLPLLWLLVAFVCVVSAAFVGIALLKHSKDFAARGGAIGVAATFFIYFMGGNLAGIFRPSAAVRALASDWAQISTRQTVAALVDIRAEQAWPFFLASVIATLFWGFGDWIAAWLHLWIFNAKIGD